MNRMMSEWTITQRYGACIVLCAAAVLTGCRNDDATASSRSTMNATPRAAVAASPPREPVRAPQAPAAGVIQPARPQPTQSVQSTQPTPVTVAAVQTQPAKEPRTLRLGEVITEAGADRDAARDVDLTQRTTLQPPTNAEGIESALARADAAVQRIVEAPDRQRTFSNTLGAIDDMLAQLELDANMTLFMAYVSTDPQQREIGQQAEQRLNEYLIDLQKNEELYAAVKAFADSNPKLEGEQKRLLEHTLRDYRRAGMMLSKEDRAKLTTIQKEISRLGIQFETNIREDETIIPLTREELAGMPDDYFANPSLETSGDMYLVSMAYPQFVPIMDYCSDPVTRKKTWLEYKRRGGKTNVAVLEQIIKLRAEMADLLGYASTADYETEIRMAKNAREVMDFYEKLRPLVRKKALLDHEELLAIKREKTGDRDATLYPWDTSYYTNQLMKAKYAVDPERVREYFPLNRVMDGLFSITQSLYGLEYREITEEASSLGIELWHEDVELYAVTDKATGETLGHFTIDLFPRDNKYTHAAQWGLAQHKMWMNGARTRPFAALVCNFTEPTADKPSLMTHDEVETFFHEFGHCLHTILSDSRYWQFSGTNVERDFVEAPSQMFENWVWNSDVLNTFAAHYETGEPFPQELLDGMIAARNVGSGMLAERQFFYGLYDMRAHLTPVDKLDELDTTKLANELWDPQHDQVELYEPVPNTWFQAGFGHLVGYQAGYYGYQWSLVYASDMFQRFEELGMLDPEAGKYYREKILSRGGTADAMDMIEDYLGREASFDAYLRHLGLEVENEE